MNAIQQRHFLPMNDFYDAPLIRTGTEDVAKQVLTEDFVIKSTVVGKITAIDENKNLIEITNTDGKKVIVPYKPKNLHNGGAGFHHQTKYTLDNNIKVGTPVKDGTVLALSSGIFKNGVITNGKLLRVTFAPHPSLIEDAGILSSAVAAKAILEFVDEKEVMISNTSHEVLSIDKYIGDTTDIGDELLRFTSKEDEVSSVLGLNISADLLDDIYESVNTKVKGVIDNIKIYYNVDEETLPAPVLTLITKLNKLDKLEQADIKDKRVIKIIGEKVLGRRMKDIIIIKFYTKVKKAGATGLRSAQYKVY